MRGLIVPERTEDFTADPVELFFDLGFVFAFSRLVYLLIHEPTWTTGAESLLLFVVLWMAWSTFTWAANAVSGNRREIRALFLIGTATSVPLGASVDKAFSSGGGTFAICASILVLMAIGIQLWGAGQDSVQFAAIQRYGLPNLLAMALLIAGGFAPKSARIGLWIVFVIVLLGAGLLAEGDWGIRPGHFAERHGLIIIIALGEVVVAIGISVVESLSESDGLPTNTLIGLIAAGTLAGLLWWGYFDRVQPALEHRAEALEGEEQTHFARDLYTWFHIPIVFGIITTAAAVEEILLHPKDEVPLEFRVMLVAGLAMFFGAIAGCALRAFRATAFERLAAVAAIAVLAFAGASLDGVTMLIAIDVVLLLSMVAEHVRIERPHQTPAAV